MNELFILILVWILLVANFGYSDWSKYTWVPSVLNEGVKRLLDSPPGRFSNDESHAAILTTKNLRP